jgi:stearoyl-CoA desaturase (delta-9 desaturase)
MKNKRYVLWVLLPIHIGVLSMFWLTSFSLLNFLFLFLGWCLIGGLGVNVGLHRWASHKAIKLNKYAKPFVVYFSIMACQGHQVWWAAIHRGSHHKHTDTPNDYHSPLFKGRWHSFIGWILDHEPSKVNYRYSVDLLREPLIEKTYKHYETIIWASWIIAGLISVDLLLWMFILPAVIGLHSEGLVNSFCHSNHGYRNFDLPNQSANVPFLGYLAWGNGWHNNHHAQPSSYDFGKGVSGRLTEFDPCVIFLPLIEERNGK